MYELIIIGGGPAGITAGIYAQRKKLKTLFLTKDFIGQAGLTSFIENWPGEKEIRGGELMEKFKEHLFSYNPEVKEERVVSLLKKDGLFEVKTEKNSFLSRAVIVATGRFPKKLNIPGEEDFVGKGVAYCTTCDAPLFQGKRVVVVGGGNAGLESAIELSDYAKEVTVLERFSKISGDEILQKKAKEKGISLFCDTEITKIEGNVLVEKIYFKNLKEEVEEVKEAEGVFIQVGTIPKTDFLKDLIDLNECGEIKIDAKTSETSIRGVFAAGDVTDVRDKQVVVAAGEGVKALLSAYKYIKND